VPFVDVTAARNVVSEPTDHLPHVEFENQMTKPQRE
jgi:hypothetical protein